MKFLLACAAALVVVLALIGFSSEPSSQQQAARQSVPAAQAVLPSDRAAAYFATVSEETAFIRSIDAATYTTSVGGIMQLLDLFDTWARIAEDGRPLHLSPDQERGRQGLLEALSIAQNRLFPVIRDAYGPALRRDLWVHDGSARTIGVGYRRLELVNALFAANRNIAEFHRESLPTFARLRFTRIDYKWFPQATDYSYYSLEPPADNHVVVWTGSSYRRVQ